MDFGVLHNKKTKVSSINNEEIIDLLNLTFVRPIGYTYKVFRVPAEYIARPDLVCIDHYGTSDYTDIVCKLNGISNPFELNEGMLITLPNASCLKSFLYDNDSIDEQASSSNDDDFMTIKPKTQNETRQANEAVISDTRYKIDREHGVVIY